MAEDPIEKLEHKMDTGIIYQDISSTLNCGLWPLIVGTQDLIEGSWRV